MPIIVTLDVVMAQRRVAAGELAARVGITPANLSILKNDHAKAVRFSTLDALCRELGCQPGDLLTYVPDERPTEPSARTDGGPRAADAASDRP